MFNMAEYYKIKLLKIEDVAKDVKKFYFKSNEKIDFISGNYAFLFNNKNPKTAGMQRPFTMTSTPNEEIVEFIIKKVGVFTTELFNLKVGEELDIEAPHGVMTYDKEKYSDKKIIFIAGGTGITPFISMYKYVKKNNLNTNFKLFYSVKSREEIIKEIMFAELDSQIILSNEKIEGYGSGRIDKAYLIKNISSEELENSYIFVCGPPVMENAIEEILKEIGAKKIIREQ